MMLLSEQILSLLDDGWNVHFSREVGGDVRVTLTTPNGAPLRANGPTPEQALRYAGQRSERVV